MSNLHEGLREATYKGNPHEMSNLQVQST